MKVKNNLQADSKELKLVIVGKNDDGVQPIQKYAGNKANAKD